MHFELHSTPAVYSQVKSYLGEIEDVVNWLVDFEQTLKAVKTIGALPDTAQKQCEKFNVSYQRDNLFLFM